MSDATQIEPPLTPTPSSKDSGSQAWVAFTIVIGLIILGVGGIIAAVISEKIAATALLITGTAVGAMANALQAPSGIGTVIAAAMKKVTP